MGDLRARPFQDGPGWRDRPLILWPPRLQRAAPPVHRGALARRFPGLSEPCHFAVFDVLWLDRHDVTGLPLSQRRALLEGLFADIPAAGVLALGMQTRDEAEVRAWYETMHVAGVEGLIIKPPVKVRGRGAWVAEAEAEGQRRCDCGRVRRLAAAAERAAARSVRGRRATPRRRPRHPALQAGRGSAAAHSGSRGPSVAGDAAARVGVDPVRSACSHRRYAGPARLGSGGSGDRAQHEAIP
ncbi:ATP-dependent DNA ligase [Nonomuraea sp. NPDC004702]